MACGPGFDSVSAGATDAGAVGNVDGPRGGNGVRPRTQQPGGNMAGQKVQRHAGVAGRAAAGRDHDVNTDSPGAILKLT